MDIGKFYCMPYTGIYYEDSTLLNLFIQFSKVKLIGAIKSDVLNISSIKNKHISKVVYVNTDDLMPLDCYELI